MESLCRFYFRKRWKFPVVFRGIFALAFVFLILHVDNLQNPISKQPFVRSRDDQWKNGVGGGDLRRRIAEEVVGGDNGGEDSSNSAICSGIDEHEGYENECEYLKANPRCNSGGFFDYIKFFYCDCEKYSVLGYIVLAIWLVTLFYLLGNTASDYFCSSLEKLSNLLRLSPTLAGVTLLPLGNGAPDVFASVASFVGTDSGAVGLNGVLGGAVFITSVVVGTVALCVADQDVRIDKRCFFRDVCFFLLASVALLLMLIVGEVSVGGAISFLSIYVVYAVFVAANELLRTHSRRLKLDSLVPLLPSYREEEEESAKFESIYSNDAVKVTIGESPENPANNQSSSSLCSKIFSVLELPLMIPRRLTIPIADEQRWSKAYAVASATLAPLLLAFLWNARDGVTRETVLFVYIVCAAIGGIFGILALVFTSRDHPPRRFAFPWIFGGFFMSIVWFYILADELVALLVTFGIIFGINPSLLAVTVLAWGNSLGDLMSNVAMAVKNRDGVQIAVSGCYAGPMFNTLIGLGLSLLLGAWNQRPTPFVVPRDDTLYYTLGFLMLSLVFALVVLPRNSMSPNKLLGLGLMTMYLVFLSVRASMALGQGNGDGSAPSQANLY